MAFNKFIKKSVSGLTRGLLLKKKRKGILHGLAKTNIRKGLGALGRGLMFRKR